MKVDIDSLIPFESISSSLDETFKKVDALGSIIVLKNNRPAYIIADYGTYGHIFSEERKGERMNTTDYKLHEAMQLVLEETKDKQMHAAALADEIYNRNLYLKKDGGKAEYTQIRARCGKYPSLFIALPGNIIKLKED